MTEDRKRILLAIQSKPLASTISVNEPKYFAQQNKWTLKIIFPKNPFLQIPEFCTSHPVPSTYRMRYATNCRNLPRSNIISKQMWRYYSKHSIYEVMVLHFRGEELEICGVWFEETKEEGRGIWGRWDFVAYRSSGECSTLWGEMTCWMDWERRRRKGEGETRRARNLKYGLLSSAK